MPLPARSINACGLDKSLARTMDGDALGLLQLQRAGTRADPVGPGVSPSHRLTPGILDLPREEDRHQLAGGERSVGDEPPSRAAVRKHVLTAHHPRPVSPRFQMHGKNGRGIQHRIEIDDDVRGRGDRYGLRRRRHPDDRRRGGREPDRDGDPRPPSPPAAGRPSGPDFGPRFPRAIAEQDLAQRRTAYRSTATRTVRTLAPCARRMR